MRINRSDWMRDTGALDLNIRQVTIPGAHNCFSYSTNKSMKAADPYESVPQIFNGIINDWAVTQSLTIQQQMEEGVRYLDMRVRKNGDVYYTLHGLYCDPLDVLLSQINQYTVDHPNEVLIIDINHTYNMNEYDYAELSLHLSNFFAEKLVPCVDGGLECPLKDFVRHQHRIFIFYDCPDSVEIPPTLWRQRHIASYWPDQCNEDHLIADIEAKGKRWVDERRSRVTVLQIILTPNGHSIRCGYIPFTRYRTSLKRMAVQSKKKLLPFMYSRSMMQFPINVLLLDFVETNDAFVEYCIQRTRETLQETAHCHCAAVVHE